MKTKPRGRGKDRLLLSWNESGDRPRRHHVEPPKARGPNKGTMFLLSWGPWQVPCGEIQAARDLFLQAFPSIFQRSAGNGFENARAGGRLRSQKGIAFLSTWGPDKGTTGAALSFLSRGLARGPRNGDKGTDRALIRIWHSALNHLSYDRQGDRGPTGKRPGDQRGRLVFDLGTGPESERTFIPFYSKLSVRIKGSIFGGHKKRVAV